MHAEYLIYKKIKGAPTQITNGQEYEKIYTMLMNYQWPMVIGNAAITKQELKELSAPKENAEENFLRKKLKAISPDSDLIYIPTILYELFVIENLDTSTLPFTSPIKRASAARKQCPPYD